MSERTPLDRIERTAGAGLVDALTALPASDLSSVLLEVARRRAVARTPAEVLTQYARDRFVRPATIDPAHAHALEAVAWSVLPPGTERVILSPVSPLGTCATVATVDQNKIVATARHTEVVGDCTNVMALEAATRRRALRAGGSAHERVRLATTHRLTRAQPLLKPWHTAHFGVIALVTAGRDEGHTRFEREELAAHIAFYVRLLEALRDRSWRIAGIEVTVSAMEDTVRARYITAETIATLREQLDVPVTEEPDRAHARGYYRDAAFHVNARAEDGALLPLGDGGIADWTRQLLSDRKERLVATGIGADLLCRIFHP